MSRKGKKRITVYFMKKYAGFTGFLLLSFFLCVNCSGSKKSDNTSKFGSYPVDYSIAYLNLAGYSKPITIRDLFGPNALYANTFYGAPSSVTVESVSGSKNEFSATILVSLKDPNGGKDINAFRVQVKFKADSSTDKSFVRYVKATDLSTGQIAFEVQSQGGEYEDGEAVGMFFEVMQFTWDENQLHQYW